MIVFHRRSLIVSTRSVAVPALILAAACLIAGCAEEIPPLAEVAKDKEGEAPAAKVTVPPVDGQVEILVLQEGGEIAHVPGSFQEAVQTKDKIVVVDFWATWCGPCKMLAPELEKIAAENEDVLVVKVDVDEAPDVAFHYQASAIPDIRIFKNGEVVEKLIGYMTADQLLEVIRGS